MFGNPETTTGGRALKFYASMRLDIRRIASLKEGDVVIGNRAKVKVVKNKVAPPFREAEFDILYGEGISKEGDLIDLGVDHKVIEKSGAWFAFDGERIGQGRENARQFLKDNRDIRNEVDVAPAQGPGPARGRVPARPGLGAGRGGGRGQGEGLGRADAREEEELGRPDAREEEGRRHRQRLAGRRPNQPSSAGAAPWGRPRRMGRAADCPTQSECVDCLCMPTNLAIDDQLLDRALTIGGYPPNARL